MEDRKIKGYVTAASTKPDSQFGFLFIRCKLISNIREKECVYLGRPWHPSSDPHRWANVVFKECYLDEHIHPDGWCEMHGYSPENERFFEYRNFGPGAKQNPKRPQLDEIEAERYTKENVLKEWKVEI
ncbi:pectinesterase family protein [Caldicellulosiruptor bescii]|uniref:pectinesterase family protein n=1 Tax=Caldicellulosiruptor bescii TaxID=31899 RepID=UPI000184795E|nr:pectinesterase family protein [Caldicellulosiruptor bescii]SMR95870.1 pectinesterase [Caldicellulosiruptor bescii]